MHRADIVIPAGFASTRLPGEPLLDIMGKPMIEHFFMRALEVHKVSCVVVATDGERVAGVVRGIGRQCLVTSPDPVSGTDRLVELMQHVDAE